MKLSEGNRMKLVLLKGEFPMFDFFYTDEDLDKVVNFEPRPGDLFLVTYPKCGTTWMQYIIWEILHDGAKPPSINQVMLMEFPFLELTGPDVLETLPPPRLFKSHMPYQYVPHSPQAKYVVVVRNPFDCCVSYFHHEKTLGGIKDLTFDEYFDHFLRGEVPYGDFFDHVLSWLPHREDENLLWVSFEDMKRDVKGVVFKVAKFLGEEHIAKLEEDPNMVRNILRHIDFRYMKDNVSFWGPAEKPSSREEYLKISRDLSEQVAKGKILDVSHDLIREGRVRNYKACMNEDQKQRLTDHMANKLKGTHLENYWKEFC